MLALLLAATGQVLALVNPTIFGKSIGGCAMHPAGKNNAERASGVLRLPGRGRFINAFINTVFTAFVGIAFLVWYMVARHRALVPVFRIGVVVLGGLTGLPSREIRSLGLAFAEIRRLQAQTQKTFAPEMQKIKRTCLLLFLQGTTLRLPKLAFLSALLWQIFQDVLSTGVLIAMQFISATVFAPLQELGDITLAWAKARPGRRCANWMR